MVEKIPESNKQLNSITINAQYIKDVSFEAPNVPAIFMEKGAAPEISVNVDVKAGKVQDDLFEVALKITTEAKVKDKTAFLCEVEYACVATIALPPESLEPVLLIEVPRLLFPFARNIIADLTRESGFPPLMINPIDFVGLYHKRLEEIAKQKENASVN
jgi:preprotein translocase subunit SecB